MCRVAVDRDYSSTAIPKAIVSRRSWTSLLLAVAVGTAMGFAEALAPVAWPPVVGLVVGCVALAVAAPSLTWLLGLVAGLAAAGADLLLGAGRPTLLHTGALGAFGAVLPALAATHAGLWIALMAVRVRARGDRR